MSKITKLYMTNNLPKNVQRRKLHDVSVLFLNCKDENINKVIENKFGETNYYIYDGDKLIFENKNIDEHLYRALLNIGKVSEINKEESNIIINGKDCKHYKYKGRYAGIEAIKIDFENEEEFKNFKKPVFLKNEIKSPLFEKNLNKFIFKEMI